MLGPFSYRAMPVPPVNVGPVGAEQPREVRCGCCDEPVPREDTVVCACCRRRACLACLRRYGHFMQVCEDCRLAEW